MKKIIFIITLFFGIVKAKAQLSFSCDSRKFCTYNKATATYGNCEEYEESSLFVISKAKTMFTHITELIKSAYYIMSSQYDKEKDAWSFDVISDVGNKYFYVFEQKNKRVTGFIDNNGEKKLIQFKVKAVF
jgi:hypothetical protein